MKLNLPENFDWDHPERYVLLIGVHPERFSFAIYDPTKECTSSYQQLGSSQEDVFACFKEYFFEEPFFQQAFQKVYLLNYYPEFTYVPSLLFDEKYKEDALNALFSEKKKGRILEQLLKNRELIILHKLPEEIYDFFHRSFVNAEFVHYSSGILSYFQDQKNLASASQLVLNFRGKELDVFCFREGNFVLGNRYDCQEVNDALYYALFTWKQLKLDQLTDYLYLVGNEKQKEEAEEKLKFYIQNVVSASVFPEQDVPFEFLTLNRCEI